jgi:hypothetical protein
MSLRSATVTRGAGAWLRGGGKFWQTFYAFFSSPESVVHIRVLPAGSNENKKENPSPEYEGASVRYKIKQLDPAR